MARSPPASSIGSAARAAARTRARGAANAGAVASPIPLDAPATSATRPSSTPTSGVPAGAGQEELHLVGRRAVGEARERVRALLEGPDVGPLPERRAAGQEPLVRLVVVGHRVGIGALERELAADDAVEAERRVVGGEADEDDAPARTQELERGAPRRLRADGVEHEVGAQPVL